jgi:hypothetical protein
VRFGGQLRGGRGLQGWFWKDGSGNEQGFVASERRGVWGKAIEVPGLGALNAGGVAGVVSVSCAPAGSCAVTGFYLDGSGSGQGFVASRRNRRWGQAIEIPGLAALNDGGGASGVSVSCPAPGSCVVGGQYVDGGDTGRGFVASQRNGRWGKAIEVPGLSALNPHGTAEINSVSCPSAGNCAAGGDYRRGSGHQQGFVASRRNDRWGKAIEVPGLSALNAGGFAEVSSVSCASAGNCAAAGYYRDGSGHDQGFVASQQNGRWGRAIEVPGLQQLNRGGNAQALAVSCAPVGDCTAGGFYPGRSRHTQGFVASQRHNP